MTGYAEARERLIAIAAEIKLRFPRQSRELIEIEARMRRRSPIRKASPRSDTVTALVRRNVLLLARNHPDLGYKEIANRTGVNQGRVSEILRGKRDE